jgi:hypothetical protein
MAEQVEPLSRLCRRVQRWAGRHGCYDLRVPFAEPLDGPAELGAAVAHPLARGPA